MGPHHFRFRPYPPAGRPTFRVGLWIPERSAALFEGPQSGDLEKGEEFLEGWGGPPTVRCGRNGALPPGRSPLF